MLHQLQLFLETSWNFVKSSNSEIWSSSVTRSQVIVMTIHLRRKTNHQSDTAYGHVPISNFNMLCDIRERGSYWIIRSPYRTKSYPLVLSRFCFLRSLDISLSEKLIRKTQRHLTKIFVREASPFFLMACELKRYRCSKMWYRYSGTYYSLWKLNSSCLPYIGGSAKLTIPSFR